MKRHCCLAQDQTVKAARRQTKYLRWEGTYWRVSNSLQPPEWFLHILATPWRDSVWEFCRCTRCALSHQHRTHFRPLLHHLTLEHLTTMVPATISYTVLLCWKNRSVMKAGKKKAMEKFLFKARTVDLWRETVTVVTTERPTGLSARRENTYADRETLVAGTTSTLLGWTRTDESHVTTLSPMRNFPGVAPPAPQMQMIWMRNSGEAIINRTEASEPEQSGFGLYHTACGRILPKTHLIKTH